jgi:hypothetical protein
VTTEVAPPPPPAPHTPPPDNPVHLDIQRPEKQSRITNFPLGIGTFIRYVLLIPNWIVLYFVALAAAVVGFLATFAILFTGKYPLGLFNFYVGTTRWSTRLSGYTYSLYDNYPPFSTSEVEGYPLHLSIDYPEQLNRLLNFPILVYLIKTLLLIPHLLVLLALSLITLIVVFIAQFAILFTGSFPAGMHSFVVGVTRWSTRVGAYSASLTDRYPPFSLQ